MFTSRVRHLIFNRFSNSRTSSTLSENFGKLFYLKKSKGLINILIKSTMTNDTKRIKTDIVSTIGTHNGTFHCDEALACYMLKQLQNMKDAKIIRTRDLEVLKTCDIVVDVGQSFDVDKNLFDHHQNDFNETFSSLRPEFGNKYNIKLSSAGLVYTYFGEDVISSILKSVDLTLEKDQLKVLYEQVYKSFIMEIDAIDNGVPICEGQQNYFITTHVSARVGCFNPYWNTPDVEDQNKLFEKASNFVGEELKDKILYLARSWLPAREIVKSAITNSKSVHPSGEIIELQKCCPWKDHLFKLEEELNLKNHHKYVLFCDDKSNDWRVICVPIEPNSFVCRKFLHKNWRGMKNISEISGIKDAKFCHSTGFIGGAFSREGVYQMALKSLENIEK